MLVLVNARWVGTAGVVTGGAIRCVSGRLELEPGRRGGGTGGEEVDVGARLVLPGAIDPHVHLREPGQAYKEGIANGTAAALKGGVTTVLDMPNNRPACTTGARLERKRRLFALRSLTNWGLHLQAGPRMPAELPARVASVKVYMARSSSLRALLEHEALVRVFARAAVVTVHAEDETRFVPGAAAHHERRPGDAILAALLRVEAAVGAIPEPRQPRLVLCHASGRAEVEWLRRMKRRGLDVWGETCPHYLAFTREDEGRAGGRLRVNPPLRSEEDRQALLEGVSDGTIDFLSSDHAPHAPDEKEGGAAASGIAGVEWLLPVALRLLVDGQRVSWSRLVELTCERAAACFGLLSRGRIRAGNAADLAVVERCERMDDAVMTRASWNPYRELRPAWRVVATVVGGRLKWNGESVVDRTPGEEVLA